MRKFQVAPFDQHLTTCDGRDLNDNQATLAALRIYPNSTILLQVNSWVNSDEPACQWEGRRAQGRSIR